jgi:hypothetical protein
MMATVPAPIDRQAQRERVVKAAVDWVYDQGCASALMELEDAVKDFMDDRGNSDAQKKI